MSRRFLSVFPKKRGRILTSSFETAGLNKVCFRAMWKKRKIQRGIIVGEMGVDAFKAWDRRLVFVAFEWDCAR